MRASAGQEAAALLYSTLWESRGTPWGHAGLLGNTVEGTRHAYTQRLWSSPLHQSA